MAISASRDAFHRASWKGGEDTGIIIGSSRGATETFERAYRDFQSGTPGRVRPSTSPTTTLGNLSTAVAQDLMLEGPELSHSITCSTALHGIVSAIAWVRSGMCQRFLVGATEAALTDFTIAQIKALRIYAAAGDNRYPCRPCERERTLSSFVLGEGAAVFAIEEDNKESSREALAGISGAGWAIEKIQSLTGVDASGDAFYRAMRNALQSRHADHPVDAVVVHAPGTIAGDAAELAAIRDLFGDQMPAIVSPKWQIGHLFGASGAFGLLYAIHLLHGGRIVCPEYVSDLSLPSKPVSSVMVNTAGFGGNVCSLIVKRWQ